MCIDTAVVFVEPCLNNSIAFQLQSELSTNPDQIFSPDFVPIQIDAPRVAAQGLSGCFLTSLDCGAHGTFYPILPAGCTCVCEGGWSNANDTFQDKFYCASKLGSWQI